MTTEEKLALAEEMVFAALRSGQRFINFSGYYLTAEHFPDGTSVYRVRQNVPFKQFPGYDCPFRAIEEYRRHLSAARDAALLTQGGDS